MEYCLFVGGEPQYLKSLRLGIKLIVELNLKQQTFYNYLSLSQQGWEKYTFVCGNIKWSVEPVYSFICGMCRTVTHYLSPIPLLPWFQIHKVLLCSHLRSSSRLVIHSIEWGKNTKESPIFVYQYWFVLNFLFNAVISIIFW